MTTDTLRYFSSRRAACKQWSVVLAVAILLIGACARLGAINVVWAAAPLLFLGLAEAGYAAQERRYAAFVKSGKQQDEAAVFLPEAAGPSVLRVVVAVLSLSIWPFYLGLIGIILAGSGALPAANREPLVPGNHIVQAPVQPYPSLTAGPMAYPGQMAQMHAPTGAGQQLGQMPPGAILRQPGGQNFPARPPITPSIVRNPPGSTPINAVQPSSHPNASFSRPSTPVAAPVAPVPKAPSSTDSH